MQLGLKGEVDPLESQWMNKATLDEALSERVDVWIKGTGEKYKLEDIRTYSELELPEQNLDVKTAGWEHLKDLDIPKMSGAVPRILIREDYAHLKVQIKAVMGKRNEPFAVLTPLGWTLRGSYILGRFNLECHRHYFFKEDPGPDLSEQVKSFWTVESFGVNSKVKLLRSKQDQRAEEVMAQTARRSGDRWEAGLLWNSDNETLPESKSLAEKRFLSLERKMQRDSVFKEEYRKLIKEYLEKGYARVLTDEEEGSIGPRTWYLPHFAVQNPNKPTKMRLVWDAAAKSHGVFLNDRLLKGPDLYNPLVGVLFVFRERSIGICGDLKEMFHQVRIREADQGSQRFLGRDQKTGKIITLQMQVMIFGAISSPYVAQEIKNRNAEEFKDEYTKACHAIISKHYMDDYLDSVDEVDGAIRRAQEVALVHSKGGFEIRNCMSNSCEVLNALPAEAVAQRGMEFSAIPENLKPKWDTWLADLKRATEIRIPRCYTLGIGEVRNVELHIFCDASEQAFAAAGYLRLEGKSGRRTVIVMAKSKVAPVKQLTIPKLELQAAVMGSRLAHTIIEMHTLKISTKILWTDSQTVIKCIGSEVRKYPPFVINRISEILDSTVVEEWRWVPTKQNVADDATRDTEHIDITSSSRWFSGPEFLALDDDDWPKEKLYTEPEISFIMMEREKLIDFSRFSSWTRLIRTMARVCRFADLIPRKERIRRADSSGNLERRDRGPKGITG